jgi:DNA-binding MarR family transcriptional regulator
MAVVDRGYKLMAEYDSLPHRYGDITLYQAESKVVQYIGKHEAVTNTQLANAGGKTPSAYSQIIRKLKEKGWVTQVRNEHNNREYNLYLTEAGWQVFHDHDHFEQACYTRAFKMLEAFSDEELELFCKVQESLNEAFRQDVSDSYCCGEKR